MGGEPSELRAVTVLWLLVRSVSCFTMKLATSSLLTFVLRSTQPGANLSLITGARTMVQSSGWMAWPGPLNGVDPDVSYGIPVLILASVALLLIVGGYFELLTISKLGSLII